MVKNTRSKLGLFIIEHITYCFSKPLWVQHNDISEAFIISVVYNLPKVMQELCQCPDFSVRHAVTATDFGELIKRNLRFRRRSLEKIIEESRSTED
jgi:hypothetical protein